MHFDFTQAILLNFQPYKIRGSLICHLTRVKIAGDHACMPQK